MPAQAFALDRRLGQRRPLASCGGVVVLIDDRDRLESVSPSPRRPPEATP
jgi:hypothetical protein